MFDYINFNACSSRVCISRARANLFIELSVFLNSAPASDPHCNCARYFVILAHINP